jgi:hypothetical protein
MAISAVSSAGGGYLQLFRSHRAEGPVRAQAANLLARVQAVPELAGREDAEGAPRQAEPGAREDGIPKVRNATLDPRRPESILKPSESDIRSRLDELRGQKAAIEGRQAAESGERSSEVLSVIAQLKSRDSQVRAHEAAHMAAGGRYITGGASYSYEKGPDGVLYAVGGEVGIDTSPVPGRPEETAQKMRTIRAAALAPSEPSSADLSVAAAASAIEADAMAEIARERGEESAAQAGPAGRIAAAGQADAAGRYGKEASAGGAISGGAGALHYDAEPPRSPLDMVA